MKKRIAFADGNKDKRINLAEASNYITANSKMTAYKEKLKDGMVRAVHKNILLNQDKEGKFSLSGGQYLDYWKQCDEVGMWGAALDWTKIEAISKDKVNNKQASKFAALVVAQKAEAARKQAAASSSSNSANNKLGILFG